MGANAQTTVPTFTAGEVLTAAQQNASARTGVPVFATTGTRDAGFGGTGEKTLAEGQLCYVEGTGLQSYNGTSWVTWGTAPSSGAMVRTGGGTLSSTSTTISNVFSATYDSYLIILSNVKALTSGGNIDFRLGTTATGYYAGVPLVSTGGTGTNASINNGTGFWIGDTSTTNVTGYTIFVHNPFLSTTTQANYSFNQAKTNLDGGWGVGYVNNTTSYTSCTFALSAGTFTTGTVNVYGLALS